MSSVVKVIEVIAQSDKGFDDAVRNAVKEAAKTITGIRSVWVENFSAKVEDDRITTYRVNCKLSFVLKGKK
ncbi:MAG: dodecin domain-containing protein [Gemmatimonadales bacterium]|nr:MAG: dodecin domain-containing protein [Gemmatimonadales bacterium]